MTIRAIACQDYIGHMSVAAHEVGFDIVGKVEQPDAFGIPAWAHNAAWFAPNHSFIVSGEESSWPAMPGIDVVYGNPPCSAFSSLMQLPKYFEYGIAGVTGRQNQCMIDLVQYGARNRASVIAFESVRAAGTNGVKLMTTLRDTLERETRHKYTLTMVFINSMHAAGFQNRARFFWVASAMGPVSFPQPSNLRIPLSESIGFLMDSVDEDPRSEYATAGTPRAQRLTMLAQTGWPEGWSADKAYEAAIAAGLEPELGRTDRIRSPYTARRWKWNEPGRVVTGGFLDESVHPRRDRTFTHREAATLMGLPPKYDLAPVIAAKSKGRTWYGKATPVQPARFIFEGIRNHLEKLSELPSRPEEVADNVFVLDLDVTLAASRTTRGKKDVPAEQETLFA